MDSKTPVGGNNAGSLVGHIALDVESPWRQSFAIRLEHQRNLSELLYVHFGHAPFSSCRAENLGRPSTSISFLWFLKTSLGGGLSSAASEYADFLLLSPGRIAETKGSLLSHTFSLMQDSKRETSAELTSRRRCITCSIFDSVTYCTVASKSFFLYLLKGRSRLISVFCRQDWLVRNVDDMDRGGCGVFDVMNRRWWGGKGSRCDGYRSSGRMWRRESEFRLECRIGGRWRGSGRGRGDNDAPALDTLATTAKAAREVTELDSDGGSLDSLEGIVRSWVLRNIFESQM